ncbi:MAG: 2-dehydropantoate 2-reductase [Bacteroidales bacterium]|nr:2-dehydropantoate 2-reductase [Bacteroidales bacterium]
MKYLIVGTGGVGGSIAGFLSKAGKEVECIARGEHLEAIRRDGLVLQSDLMNETLVAKIPAYSEEEYMREIKKRPMAARPDVIFISVKGYSLEEIAPMLDHFSKPGTLCIPILNGYGIGPRLQNLVEEATVIDGLIYLVAYIESPGHVRQVGRVFNIIYGSRPHQRIPASRLEQIAMDLRQASLKVEVSDDINRDTFIKWGFISAMSCTGAYFDCPMGPIQKQGPERQLFTGLCRESYALGVKLGIHMPADYMIHNLSVIDHLDPDVTASMQKDISRHHASEIDGQLFALAELGHEMGVDMSTYDKVCEKFKNLR